MADKAYGLDRDAAFAADVAFLAAYADVSLSHAVHYAIRAYLWALTEPSGISVEYIQAHVTEWMRREECW